MLRFGPPQLEAALRSAAMAIQPPAPAVPPAVLASTSASSVSSAPAAPSSSGVAASPGAVLKGAIAGAPAADRPISAAIEPPAGTGTLSTAAKVDVRAVCNGDYEPCFLASVHVRVGADSSAASIVLVAGMEGS